MYCINRYSGKNHNISALFYTKTISISAQLSKFSTEFTVTIN